MLTRVKRWTLLTALPLATSIVASCLVYDPSDLTGLGGDDGQSGAGRGGSLGGGPSGGAGAQGGRGGDIGASGSESGSGSLGGASSGRGGGSAGAGRAGEGGTGEGGESGGSPSGGSGGSSGSGTSGTSGSAGTGTVAPKTAIDDLEDGDHRIKRLQGPPPDTSPGSWYTYAVPSAAELLPASTPFTAELHPEATPGPEPPNDYALRLFVRQVPVGAGNGAAGGVNFLEPKTAYDGSRYIGVAYWARASKSVTVRVQVVTKGTDSDLGSCTDCSDHYFKEDTIGTSWAKFEGYWFEGYADERNEFAQDGWGDTVLLKPDELVAVQFFVPAAATNPQIELWLDNIAFIPR
jgi:hypothetical protein